MMQQSRREHGSSGELDVFGATSYFAGGGLPNNFFPGEPAAAALLIQAADKVTRGTMMQDSFRGPPRHVPDDDEHLGLHDDERHGQQLGVVVGKPSGGNNKSKIAALLSFVVSPSPRASFRKESPPSPPPAAKKLLLLAAGGDEPTNKVPSSSSSSSSSSSRESSVVQLQGCDGVHDELDLGVATGDRRLQGVRVVRGRSGGEERWVVRCSAWEEHHESMLVDDAAGSSDDPKDEAVEEGGDGNPAGGDDDWESDCSSDLFDLDLEYIC